MSNKSTRSIPPGIQTTSSSKRHCSRSPPVRARNSGNRKTPTKDVTPPGSANNSRGHKKNKDNVQGHPMPPLPSPEEHNYTRVSHQFEYD